MTEAWRPFSDEEVRKIIEGQQTIECPLENSVKVSLAKKKSLNMSRIRPLKRNLDGKTRLIAEKITENGSYHDKISGKCLGNRIPKIPEEKEEDEEETELTEPVLKSQSIDIPVRRLSDPTENRTGSEITVLEKFQEKQRIMEEQNKQNKELLQRTLSDRAKKTREEAEKLNHIEEELRKLDNMLSSDVTIIRDQIEIASQEYMEAQKRYDKAEKEYIAAKLNLFNYRERKEMLTSHLCTIIEKNEMRKAQKLSDLMRKLEMGVDISSLTLDDSDLKEETPNVIDSPPKESK